MKYKDTLILKDGLESRFERNVGKAGSMCLYVLRFWQLLLLHKPHQRMHACGDESVECYKAAQLFYHLFQ